MSLHRNNEAVIISAADYARLVPIGITELACPAIAIATVRLGQASQKRAVDNNRQRLKERGLSRDEVRELAKDKALVRKLPAAWRWTMRRLRD